MRKIFKITEDTLAELYKKGGEWLLDISKYIATAVVITAFFEGIQKKKPIIGIGVAAIVVAIFVAVVAFIVSNNLKNKKS